MKKTGGTQHILRTLKQCLYGLSKSYRRKGRHYRSKRSVVLTGFIYMLMGYMLLLFFYNLYNSDICSAMVTQYMRDILETEACGYEIKLEAGKSFKTNSYDEMQGTNDNNNVLYEGINGNNGLDEILWCGEYMNNASCDNENNGYLYDSEYSFEVSENQSENNLCFEDSFLTRNNTDNEKNGENNTENIGDNNEGKQENSGKTQEVNSNDQMKNTSEVNDDVVNGEDVIDKAAKGKKEQDDNSIEANGINNNENSGNPNVESQNGSESNSVKETGGLLVTDYTSPVKQKDVDVSQLSYDFLMSNYYTVVSSTTLKPEDIDAQKLLGMDLTMKQTSDKPQILIYHTHGQEGFVDSTPGNPETGIVGVGSYLAEILKSVYGYNVIHVSESYDYVNGVLDRHKAYDYAYDGISEILKENPSIEMVLDIHRDGVDENTHLVTTVNGKPTAKVMYFNGISRLNGVGEIDYLYNPHRTGNLALSLKMKVLSEEYYEGFARRNYIQAYQYNLHMRDKSMLIEVGAQNNTLQEELNAMEPLATLIDKVLKGE